MRGSFLVAHYSLLRGNARVRVRLGVWLTLSFLPDVYLDSSLTACSGVESTAAPQKLLILDARSYTAAVANRAKGGGCECEGIAVIPVSAGTLCFGVFVEDVVWGQLVEWKETHKIA